MRLLLDTHIFLALLELGSSKLPRPVLDTLTDNRNDLFVSTATFWEIAIKVRSGKLSISMPLEALPDVCSAAGTAVMTIEPHHVLAELSPLPATRDPFDRLLLAQASVEVMRLVTLDRALIGHPLAWAPPHEQPTP